MRTPFLIIASIFISFFTQANDWKILKPTNAHRAYEIAANEFQAFYHAVTGQKLEIINTPQKGNLIVIG